MATYNSLSGVASENPKNGSLWVARGRVNFKELADKRGAAIQASDTVAIMTIPANTTAIAGCVHSPRVEGGTLTVDTGTTAGGNEIDDAFNANNNTTPLAFDTLPLTEGAAKLNMASGATIYVTPKNAADVGIVDVHLVCFTHTDDFVTT